MRNDEDDEPRVHRVYTEADARREAQMGLDQLLARGKAIVSREAREKAARQTDTELEASRIRRMRLAQAQAERFEWRPIAAGALFEEQICRNCGSIHDLFRGYGVLYQRRANFVERWERADCLDRGLPFQKRKLIQPVPVCSNCIDTFAENVELPPYEFHPQRKED